jgi:hypothetical protein
LGDGNPNYNFFFLFRIFCLISKESFAINAFTIDWQEIANKNKKVAEVVLQGAGAVKS